MIEKIKIDKTDKTPKYLQLAQSISTLIDFGILKINDQIPSVQRLAEHLNLSRETVFKALGMLSEKGILIPVKRKGYFIQKSNITIDNRVLLMLDKMTPFKEEIYNALRNTLSDKSEVEIFLHHGNNQLFKSIIQENINNFNYFVISTFLDQSDSEAIAILNSIPNGKLILIDKFEKEVKKTQSQIYQDFESNIFESLMEIKEILLKYKEIILVAPEIAPHRFPVIEGFKNFCEQNLFNFSIIEKENIDTIQTNTLYLLTGAKEDNLVKIIKFCRNKGYSLGKEIGIISYNETQMKEILEGGITVISTNFYQMGVKAAQLIINRTFAIEANPSRIIVRNSI
ncbi:MAG: GntR family transcriptional regulator [Flavobacteriaceae bacterium]